MNSNIPNSPFPNSSWWNQATRGLCDPPRSVTGHESRDFECEDRFEGSHEAFQACQKTISGSGACGVPSSPTGHQSSQGGTSWSSRPEELFQSLGSLIMGILAALLGKPNPDGGAPTEAGGQGAPQIAGQLPIGPNGHYQDTQGNAIKAEGGRIEIAGMQIDQNSIVDAQGNEIQTEEREQIFKFANGSQLYLSRSHPDEPFSTVVLGDHKARFPTGIGSTTVYNVDARGRLTGSQTPLGRAA